MGGGHSTQKENGAATIFQKGLPNPDIFQTHALQTVRKWGLDVIQEFSQEYGERGSSRVKHSNGHLYSPPTIGWVGIPPTMHTSYNRSGMEYKRIPRRAWECYIDRTIKIGIKNENVDFTGSVGYHGVRVDSAAPLQSNQWRGGVRPLKLEAAGGCHGPGLYLTPSFRMAGSYAFRRWSSEERFSRTGPDKTCYLAIVMCAVTEGKYTKNTGSAFSHNTDGWRADELEWVIKDPRDAKPYGMLICYFRPWWELQPDPCLTAKRISVDGRSTDSGKVYLSCRADGLVDLYSHDDGSGRQQWNFVSIGGNKYNILIKGGTNSDKIYLSCRADGHVDLYSHDDRSGRQQWLLKAASGGNYHINVAGGTRDGKIFLSCRADGHVDLYSHDDGSGRQAWKLG